MSFRIDLEKTLQYAEGLYIQLSQFKNLPTSICEILGFAVQEKQKPKDDLDLVDEKLARSNLNDGCQNLNDSGSSNYAHSNDTSSTTNNDRLSSSNRNNSNNENDSSIEVLR